MIALDSCRQSLTATSTDLDSYSISYSTETPLTPCACGVKVNGQGVKLDSSTALRTDLDRPQHEVRLSAGI